MESVHAKFAKHPVFWTSELLQLGHLCQKNLGWDTFDGDNDGDKEVVF